MLMIFYHVIRSGASHADLAGSSSTVSKRLTRDYVKGLERLGHKVALESVAA